MVQGTSKTESIILILTVSWHTWCFWGYEFSGNLHCSHAFDPIRHSL